MESAPEGERHAKLITSGRNGPDYYLLVTWRKDTFDVCITDLKQAWEVHGFYAQEKHRLSPQDWRAKAQEALTVGASATNFSYEVKNKNDNIELIFEWDDSSSAFKTIGRIPLSPVADSKACINSLLALGSTSYNELRAAFHSLESSCASLRSQLESTQKQLAQQAKERQEHEATLYLKFSVLLNEKKRHLRALREELEETKQRLESARGSDDMEEGTTQQESGGAQSGSDAQGGDEGAYSAQTQEAEGEEGEEEASTVDPGARVQISNAPLAAAGKRRSLKAINGATTTTAMAPAPESESLAALDAPTQPISPSTHAPLPSMSIAGRSTSGLPSQPGGFTQAGTTNPTAAASPLPAAAGAVITGAASTSAAAAVAAGDNWDLAELTGDGGGDDVLPSTSVASRPRVKRPRR